MILLWDLYYPVVVREVLVIQQDRMVRMVLIQSLGMAAEGMVATHFLVAVQVVQELVQLVLTGKMPMGMALVAAVPEVDMVEVVAALMVVSVGKGPLVL
ncbi:hypothetical protein [Citrobacter braakii]|uniref:hypothetical protein n=1 Tax=Citrobacter braakii TaxID=57706 RepID=UPI002FF8334F